MAHKLWAPKIYLLSKYTYEEGFCPKISKGGTLRDKMETFHQHFFLLKKIIWDNQNVIWGYQNVGKGKDLLKSHICCGPSARLNIPKTHKNSKLWVVFGVFAVKYTYFKPQNILIEANNILMISYTYEAKICRTTPVCILSWKQIL